jgi:hypothetical protein
MSPVSQTLPDFRISVFPSDTAIWRVSWFGSITYPDRSARSTQPSVRIHLSEVADPQVVDEVDPLLPAEGAASVRRIASYVSVGTTMLLRIGDLWQNQVLVAKPAYELEEFRDVQIDRETVHVVKAGSSFEDGTFLLPRAEHPWHMANTHSYCLTVSLNDDRLLVIPAMEVIRFYFGSSSSLLAKLFTTGIKKDALFTSAHFERRPGLATLQLAAGIPRASAHDVARIAFDNIAWRAAALVSKSCLRASVRGSEIFPQGVFPFEGRTTLQVKGKWLSRGNQPRQTFLVYELRSCSFAFPYSVLSYRVADGQTSDTTRKGSGEVADGQRRAASRSAKPQAPGLHERDASKLLAPETAYLPRIPRFPDLIGKLTYSDENVDEELPLSSAGAPSPAVDAMAVGEAGSSERVRPVTLAEYPKWKPGQPAPEHLAPLLEALDEFTGTVALLTASDEDGWTIPVTICADMDGVIDEALFEGGTPRRLCALRVTAGSADGVLAALGTAHVLYLIVPLDPGTDAVDAGQYMPQVVGAVTAQPVSKQAHEQQAPSARVTGDALLGWLTEWVSAAAGDLRLFVPAPDAVTADK